MLRNGGLRRQSLEVLQAVVDEFAFVNWFQHVAEGVIDDPIPKGGGANFALFAVLDEKAAIDTWAVRFFLKFKFALELEQVAFGIKFKGGDGWFLPLALTCFAPGIV